MFDIGVRSVTVKYSVKEVAGSKAEEIARRVWAENLPVRSSLDQKFHWFYTNNPSTGSAAFALQDADGESGVAVGWAGVGVRRFRIAGANVLAGLLADLSLDKKHRTVYPALLLVRAACDYCRSQFVFFYGYPNRAAASVCARAGVSALGQTTRFARIVDFGAHATQAGLPKSVASTINLILVAIDQLRLAVRRNRREALKFVDAVDSRLDDLWGRARDQFLIVGERGVSQLRWRFFLPPYQKCQLALLEDKDNGRVEAYAIYEVIDGVMYIRDVFGTEIKAIGRMFDNLVVAARALGLRSLSITFFGSSTMVRQLHACGFVARERERQVIFEHGPYEEVSSEQWRDPESWFLTDFDEDQ